RPRGGEGDGRRQAAAARRRRQRRIEGDYRRDLQGARLAPATPGDHRARRNEQEPHDDGDTVAPPIERIIDAHHHLWDLGQNYYPRLSDRVGPRMYGDYAAIRRNYLLEDFRRNIGMLPVVASVHVQ